jgi:hypothetical protein
MKQIYKSITWWRIQYIVHKGIKKAPLQLSKGASCTFNV